MKKKDKCANGVCNNETDYLHACPFQSEINDDNDDYCSCCEECEASCSDEI